MRRVFIVGCPRSGTTLVQSILAANTLVASFPESHFFEKLFTDNPVLSALGIASRRIWRRWPSFLGELGHPEFMGFLPWWAVLARQHASAYVGVLDTLSASRGKTVWVEKTPGHLRHWQRIQALVPDARFIHIIRPGPDNIASLYDMASRFPAAWAQWFGTIDQCVQRWVQDARISLACSEKAGHHLVHYTQLIRSPRPTVADLCAFIGVLFEESMLTDYGASARALVLPREAWKASVFEPISENSTSRFESVFTEEQRQRVSSMIPEELRDLESAGRYIGS